MNKKIYGSLMICLMLGLTIVSAATISNIEVDYNKKDNIIHVEFDETLRNECAGVEVSIFNHKAKDVRTEVVWNGIINCIVFGNTVVFGGRTGTFHRTYDIELVDKNQIKGLGNLRYELSKLADVLAQGYIK